LKMSGTLGRGMIPDDWSACRLSLSP
jgi:hypothetical protein